MMIAQVMQKLFGPVFQGLNPEVKASLGGDSAGAFAGLMADGGDSPIIAEEAGDTLAPVPPEPSTAADDTAAVQVEWMPSAALPAFLPSVVQGGAAPQIDADDRIGGIPAAPVQDVAASHDSGLAMVAYAGPAPSTLNRPAQWGDNDAAGKALLENAVQIAQLNPRQYGATGAVPLSPIALPTAAETAGVALPEDIPAGQVALAQLRAMPDFAQKGLADLQSKGAGGAKLVPEFAAAGPQPQPSYAQAQNQPQSMLATVAPIQGVDLGAARLPRAMDDVQVQSLVQPAPMRPKLPLQGGVIAALQAFAQDAVSGGAAGQGAQAGEADLPTLADTALETSALANVTARNMAALYAPSTQNLGMANAMIPVMAAAPWGEGEADGGDLLRGEAALSAFGLGEGRSAGPQPLGSSAQAGPSFASHTPSAAQISAQILSNASAAQSGPVELVLSPAELGHLRFEIHHRGDQVQIVLSAERPETLDLLRRNSEQLVNDFRNAGFTGASLSFGGWGAGQNENAQAQRFESQPQSEGENAPLLASPTPAQAARFTGPSAYLDPSRSLNLRL